MKCTLSGVNSFLLHVVFKNNCMVLGLTLLHLKARYTKSPCRPHYIALAWTGHRQTTVAAPPGLFVGLYIRRNTQKRSRINFPEFF